MPRARSIALLPTGTGFVLPSGNVTLRLLINFQRNKLEEHACEPPVARTD